MNEASIPAIPGTLHGRDNPNAQARDARILARRKRIQDRLATLREGDVIGGKEGEKKEEIGKGKQQLVDSRRRLYRVKLRTDQDASAVRVAGDERETAHRAMEEMARQELRGKLLAEAEQSARHNAAVAMRWADLFSIEVPQDLYQEIEKQRQSCQKLISSKDKLISEIKSELKKKDDEFVRTLKKQAEDIDTLLQFMSRQFVEMQNAYKDELDEIENAFLAERDNTLLSGNKTEIEKLFKTRYEREDQHLNSYLATVAKYQDILEDLRKSDAEDYHILKIRLETDIQNLEQHLEAMRATYQLNTEKLEYNYRVLVERDHENQATINQQKRKISRQRDILSSLKSRYLETDRKYMEENMRLTDEYKRITEQFKDLQGKFRHFELVDTKKYTEVWSMKEAEVAAKVKLLLQADKVIHEQQLGWAWLPPDDALFLPAWQQASSPARPGSVAPSTRPGSRKQRGQTQGAGEAGQVEQGQEEKEGGGQQQGGQQGEGTVEEGEMEGEEEEEEEKEEGCSEGGDSAQDEEAQAAKRAEAELQERLRDPRSYGALSLLVDEAGFLTDAKAKAVMERLPKDEAGLVAAESIVRALGVVDGISFDTLMDALSADSNIEVKAKGLGGLRMPVDDGVGRQGGAEGGHSSVLVHPDDAVKRLKAFVEVENTAPARSGLAGPSRATGAMRRAAELEQEFWTRMAHVISDKGSRVWRALEKQLQRYHGLLQTRANNLADVDSLQTQNDELRALLNQYLGSRINEELEIPPTQII